MAVLSNEDLRKERASHEARIQELRELTRQEWTTMSVQVSQDRAHQIHEAQARIARIDATLRRRGLLDSA